MNVKQTAITTSLAAAILTVGAVSNAEADTLYFELGTSWNYTEGTEYYGTEWLGEYEGGYMFDKHKVIGDSVDGRFMFYAEHTSSVPDMKDSGHNMAGIKYRFEYDL